MRNDRPENNVARSAPGEVGRPQNAAVSHREQDLQNVAPAATRTTTANLMVRDSSALCVNCGLCCNGVLYSNIKAQPDEVPRLEAAGHSVDQVAERLHFHPPCHFHVGGRCSIYATRFKKCRAFRCALLMRVDAGETSLTDAAAAVARSKEMVARIGDMDPDLTLLVHRVALRRGGRPQTGSGDPARNKKWLESVALDMVLDRTFRNNPVLTSYATDGSVTGGRRRPLPTSARKINSSIFDKTNN